MTTYKFHINGMHCKSCVLLTESKIGALSKIETVKSSLKDQSIEVSGDFGEMTEAEIVEELTGAVKLYGYTVTLQKIAYKANWSDFKTAVPVAIGFFILFFFLQKSGLLNIVGSGKVGYGTAFLVGVIASLSTCMAVVGGLLLSMSATFAKEGSKSKSQLMFHLGRIFSFFIFGGIIGAIGSAFTLNTAATFVLGIIIALVMLIMGLNLLDVFPWAWKLQPSMPKFISKNAHGISNLNHTLTPLLVGIATFFLPCGFTQSMQLYTLTTGSFMSGALTMLSFALGTLPVLSAISFSSFSIQNSQKAGIFFKSAGLIVIIFALFNLLNSLVIIGLIPPIFSI